MDGRAHSSRATLVDLAGYWAGPVWFGATVVGAILVAYILALTSVHGHDALSYWLVDPATPYARAGDGLHGSGAFRYSPAIAILVRPFGILPWPVFTTIWLALQLGVLWLLAGRWWLALVLLPPVLLDLFAGNIDIFIALAVAASFRFPGAWAFVALTKVTPVVGAVWLVGRRDWRGLAWAAGVTAACLAGSLLLLGVGPWIQWIRMLSAATWASPEGLYLPISIVPRVLAATAIAYYAGATDRRWLVPVAVVVAMPTLWIIALTPLIAWAPQIRERYSETFSSRVGPRAASRIRTPTVTPVMTTEPAMVSARASGIVHPSGGTATSRSSRKVIANTIHATATAGRPRARSRNTNAG
jgi:hypothetical protein